PAGLLLAALVQSPYRSWPALLLAACGANLASNVLLHDMSVPVSLGFCVANCGDGCLGAWLLRRFVGTPLTLARVTEVLGLACWSALVSPALGATIGAGIATVALGATSYWSAWLVWWMSSAAGVLVIAPVALTWTAEGGAFFKVVRPWRIAEIAAL